MNLRIYKLDLNAYNVHKGIEFDTNTDGSVKIGTDGNPVVKSTTKKYTDFEQWRELKYYEYIRDYILKKNVCPNFVGLFGYYINEKSQIDFDKIEEIKDPSKVKPKPGMASVPYTAPTTVTSLMTTLNRYNSISYAKPEMYFGQALVALTESPLYNLYAFASTLYERDGAVKRMISTGYYNENIWYSILFQIMVALYILQKEEIYFNNFEVEHNIFIKDLSLHSNLTNFWKYRINGVDYYVPNYGYLAMFDANYTNDTTKIHDKSIKTRIYAKPLEDNPTSSIDIKKLIFNNMFKKVFDPNIFGKEFTGRGGVPPPPEIINLLRSINGETETDIKYYIEKYMMRFVNNRIGTYLKELEVPNIRRDESNFNKGQILVNEVGTSTYKFVILLKNNGNGTSLILSKNDNMSIPEFNRFENKTVPNSSLFGYLRTENIEQTFKPNEINLNEDDLLESYLVD
jgi:hypothetical protein